MAEQDIYGGSIIYKLYKNREKVGGELKGPVMKDYFRNTYEDTPLGNYAIYNPPGGITGSPRNFGQSYTPGASAYTQVNKNWWIQIVDRAK